MVLILWIVFNLVIGAFYMTGIFDDGIMMLICLAYSVCDMICILAEIRNGKIKLEGDEIIYRVAGEGTPLLLISGGGGNGDLYMPLAEKLTSDYKVITYDRRANAGSTMNHPEEFSLEQQARDAVEVMHAARESSAIVFGNSSGAVIALEVLRLFLRKEEVPFFMSRRLQENIKK